MSLTIRCGTLELYKVCILLLYAARDSDGNPVSAGLVGAIDDSSASSQSEAYSGALNVICFRDNVRNRYVKEILKIDSNTCTNVNLG